MPELKRNIRKNCDRNNYINIVNFLNIKYSNYHIIVNIKTWNKIIYADKPIFIVRDRIGKYLMILNSNITKII